MDHNLALRISRLANWDDIASLEINARERGRLTTEVADALRQRSIELAKSFIAEKTGIDLTSLSPAEEKIVRAVGEYVAIKKREGKYPGRTLEQIKNRGLLGAAENAVCRATPTQGYQSLVDASLEELSYEQIVIEHPDEFSPRAVWFSRRTLGLPNTSDAAPADTGGDTQTRTVTVLQWQKQVAKENDGVLPAFTNVNTAAILGMDDLQRYGRVLGNIQSRIDFACYRCGLPPLGLAADSPFERAWAQEGRDWKFPVDTMQAAAQARVWADTDFDQVLRVTEELPGQAHIFWTEELSTNEAQVKAWAYGPASKLSDSAPRNDQEPGVRRNPPWSRDELILALDLYLRHRESPPGKDSKEVTELSNFLNHMGEVLGLGEADSYRNTNGVYMKMMNFRHHDPEYVKDGRVGLARGNKDEVVVWHEFSGDPVRLVQVVAAIRATVETHTSDRELEGADDPDIVEAEEGRVLTRLHRVRERNRKLVEAKKKQALKEAGKLICEACGFDFVSKYGPTAEGIIDVHHTKPVHTLMPGDTTKLDDLALLCANCHRIVHSAKKWLTIEQVKALV
ncbi:MAG: HNH endonuclease [Sulfuritalea sp.]|nr:HNH endonuclease [Sulfuritalea sp.]